MRSRILIGWLAIFALSLIACSLGSASPTQNPIGPSAPTATQAAPPLAPTDAPIAPSATVAPVNTLAPLIGVATTTPVTGTDIITGTPTPEGTPGATSEATLAALPTLTPRPPVSTGPLEFTIDVAGCRADPSREGGVTLTMRFNPTGGSGVYRYFDDDIEVTQIYERPATKGSGVIAAFRVESSDGQKTSNIKFQFKVNEHCN